MPITQKALEFLFENRVRDSREWFAEHRAEYDELVLAPLRQLVIDLAPAMGEIDEGLICSPKVGGSISRIYRDTRFSKDKSIYRDVMWVVFLRSKQDNVPGFWMEFSPRGAQWGCGWYQTDPETMQCARELILSGDAAAKKAISAFRKQKRFILEDNRYKRAKFPDLPEREREWLEQKSLCLTAATTDPEFICSDDLAERVAEDFRLLVPEYEFMLKAHSRAAKKP